MRRIPIQTKLFAALAVPLIALLTVITYEVFKSAQEANEVRDQAELAKAATGPNGVFTALQNERNRAAAGLIGFDNSVLKLPVENNEEARSETDDSLTTFKTLIDSQGEDVIATYAPAFDKLEEIKAIRADIDAQHPPFESNDPADSAVSNEIFSRYSEIIDDLLKSNTKVALAIDDPELRRGADLSHMATRQLDLIARLVRTYLQAGINEDLKLLDRDEVREAGGLYGQAKENQDDIFDLSTGDYEAAGVRLKKFNDSLGFMEEIAPEVLRTGTIPVSEILEVVSVPPDESYYGYRERVKEALDEKAADLEADANGRRGRFMGLGILAFVVAGVAVWWVSRSITRPLRALTRQATDMANHRLPDAVLDILDTPLGDDVSVPTVEPIAVQTRDEVADVAEALNTVQDSALDLAVEQAVLRRNIADSFVNLGRRNQNLLGRQLDFITELEHNETDPDTLANLFRLDHLATRMRRNAESLLVLAGIDPPRKWAAPVRITDAIRAALGEVEDYQRVTVRAVEATTIIGSAAADLAHLLAELIENALIFSPPDQTVEIRGRSQPAGYTLAVIDSGLGMPPEELARANRRLAGAESFTIAPSKYLGHYVAGNLAARHNINVTLHNSPGHGITATINLPPPLLTADDGTADTAPGAPTLSATPTLAARRDLTSQQAIASAGVSVFGSEGGGFADSPAAAGLASTTASGLAKRTPRSAPGPGAAQPAARLDRASFSPGVTQPATADDDLIRTLAQYTTQLHQQLQSAPPAVPPPPAAGVGTPISPATGTPALRHMPPFPVTPPGGLMMPRATPNTPPSELPKLAPRGPLPQRPPAPPLPGSPGMPPPGSGTPGRPPLLPPPGAEGDSQTAAGLTRRVRGAQLPNTQTVSLRRGDNTGPGATAPRPPQSAASIGGPFGRPPTGQNPIVRPGDGPPPPPPSPQSPPPPPAPAPPSEDGWASERTAKDTYGFLSDFTAGVQRGLDETKASGNGD